MDTSFDFQLNGTCSDSGGPGLSHLALYWGYSSAVSNSNYNGSFSQVLSGMSDPFSFVISHQHFKYDQRVYYIFYYNDTGNDLAIYSGSILPTDIIPPVISADANLSQNIGYLSDKAIGFTVIEPANSSGVNTSSVACYFNNGQNSLSGGSKSDFVGRERIALVGDNWIK